MTKGFFLVVFYSICTIVSGQELLTDKLLEVAEIEGFDLDMYFILVRFLFDSEKRKLNNLKVVRFSSLSIFSFVPNFAKN